MGIIEKKIRTVKTVKTVTIKKGRSRPPLSFGKGNAKLKGIHTFSLPAGYACPFAQNCLSKANRLTGKMTDGPDTQFRCFSASQEGLYPSVRTSRWRNFETLRGLSSARMTALLLESLPRKAKTVRVHVSGDFFSQAYFDAWMEVARQRPDLLFYAYTKSLPYWVTRREEVPSNFILTASKGGRHDELITRHNLRFAEVVLSELEAAVLGLPLDHDDSHAMSHGPSFALLIHGMQPAGTPASKAVAALKAAGDYGYGERADALRAKASRIPLHTI